jgi:hypothetical protein
MFSRLLRRTGALAALLAISLQAFWPALVQAQPKSISAGAICSAGGGEHGAGKHFRHCALCGGADRFQALVPSPAPFAALPVAAMESPAARPAPLHSEFRRPANPRAPPARS